jgi:hypothetical protein
MSAAPRMLEFRKIGQMATRKGFEGRHIAYADNAILGGLIPTSQQLTEPRELTAYNCISISFPRSLSELTRRECASS